MSRGMLPFEVVGDLLLIETAILFILAGIIDFGSSLGVAQFRRTLFRTKEGFSPSGRKDAERRALILVAAGAILFLLLLLLALS
jgi:hypothetical protein